MEFAPGVIDKSKFISIVGRHAPLVAVLAVASFFIFSNLGNQYLWQDEAETALVGKTIMSQGIPYGTDGKNYFSQEMIGETSGKEPWRMHPWLQFYAVAASYSLLGVSTFSTRFPFALFGLAAIIITYAVTLEQFRSRSTALIAAALLTVSVPFMILCRQGRWYSAVTLFFLLSLWSYARFTRASKYSMPALIAASTLTFHSYYPACLVLMAGFIIHAFLFHRDIMKRLFIALAAIGFLNFPWFLWFKVYSLQGRPFFSLSRIIANLPTLESNFYVFLYMPWVIVAVLIILTLRYFKLKKYPPDIRNLINPICLYIIMIIGITATSLISNIPQLRYLSPAIPLFCVLMAIIVRMAFKMQILIGIAVLAFLIWMQPLDKLIYEITHDFKGPINGIVKYLNENGKNGDIVLVTYGDLPLKFYTNYRVIGGLTGENLETARDADWVIVRKYMISNYEIPVRQFIRENISASNYQKITIDYPDTPFENRESPADHYFKTVINEDRVVLYKRIR